MTERTSGFSGKSPSQIARETLQILESRNIAPTPDAFLRLYSQVYGLANDHELDDMVARLKNKFSLTHSAKNPASAADPFQGFAQDSEVTQLLRDLLVRNLMYLLPSLIESDPELVEESQRLAEALKTSYSTQDIRALAQRIKDFYFSINRHTADSAERQAEFIRSLNIMLDNFKDALATDKAMVQEVEEFQRLILVPTQQKRIDKAIRHLREMVFRHKKR